MKTFIFLPLAYLADVQGFLLFAPYAILFLSVALVLRTRSRAAAVAAIAVAA